MSEPVAVPDPSSMSHSAVRDPAFVCPNCGQENHGAFCSACGQKKLREGDLSLAHVWHHLFHELLHLDGKIFSTLWLLIRKPGQPTLDFLEGRRARHVHPIHLFLVVGAVYFLFTKSVWMPFDFQADTSERSAAWTGFTLSEFTTEAKIYAAAVFKGVYTFTLLLNGVYLWALFRRKYPYLAEHMVFAIHLACFSMTLWVVLVTPAHFFGVSRAITMPLEILMGLSYFVVSAARVYSVPWWRLILAYLIWAFFSWGIMEATKFSVAIYTSHDVSAYVRVQARPAEPAQVIAPKTKISLFDGQSLANWVIVNSETADTSVPTWTVANAEIHCSGLPPGHLRTNTRYRDYVLRYEWRWLEQPNGYSNSGVFVHVSGSDRMWPRCLEIDLVAGGAGTVRVHADALVNEVRGAEPVQVYIGSALKPAVFVNEKMVWRRVKGIEKTPGEWNAAEVVCRGATMTVKINGVLENEVTQSTVTEGAIALQAQGVPIAFRNIELSPLP